MDEFELIKKYFNWEQKDLLNPFDDCAVVNFSSDKHLVTSIDTIVQGIHFFSNTSPNDIAYKALAVNLSDLAAMGAKPKYFTLALTLPSLDKKWLSKFSYSLKNLANKHNINLIGGDTTKGFLTISISVIGEVEKNKALLRSTAQVGDLIFVSNTIGDAAYALKQIKNGNPLSQRYLKKLNRPEPQLVLGKNLIGIANSCIDISDGLEQDLMHILKKSKVGASICLKNIPLSKDLSDYINKTNDSCLPLAGGDDYELCFTAPKKYANIIKSLSAKIKVKLTQIGVVNDSMELTRVGNFNKECNSYKHF
jgi:thiamine-monophosphate kinase